MNNILGQRATLKEKLRRRERLFASWVSYACPSITETFARAGFDFIVIDMEHSTISLEQAQRIIAASQSEGVPCLPRPVSHSNDWFKPLLESGADGLMVQMVNTPEEVEAIIGHLKYPRSGAAAMASIEPRPTVLTLMLISIVGTRRPLFSSRSSRFRLSRISINYWLSTKSME